MKRGLLKWSLAAFPGRSVFPNAFHAATVSWVGGIGDWNTATNWITGSSPRTSVKTSENFL